MSPLVSRFLSFAAGAALLASHARAGDPIDLNGEWTFQVQVTQATGVCAGDLGEYNTVPGTVTQTGAQVTVELGNATFTGVLVGSTLNIAGCYPEDGGTSCWLSTTWDVSSCEMEGTTSWSWNGGGFSCVGQDYTTAFRSSPAGCLGLRLQGKCGGPVAVDVFGATPLGDLALVWSANPTPSVVPGLACGGVTLELSQPKVFKLGTLGASGDVSALFDVPLGACGLYLQAVDLSTCRASNVAVIP